MTTKTLDSKIAAMSRVLADATKEHLACQGEGTYDYVGHGGGIETDDCPKPECKDGRAARFKGFRQECSWCRGKKRILKHFLVIGDEPYRPVNDDYDPCTHCQKNGWQVRAGGVEDALAGLGIAEGIDILRTMCEWLLELEPGLILRPDVPMPSADVIRAKTLELVIKVAGLEVPDA